MFLVNAASIKELSELYVMHMFLSHENEVIESDPNLITPVPVG
jgi:hypothetical protein